MPAYLYAVVARLEICTIQINNLVYHCTLLLTCQILSLVILAHCYTFLFVLLAIAFCHGICVFDHMISPSLSWLLHGFSNSQTALSFTQCIL